MESMDMRRGCFKYVAVVNGVALRFARIYATVNIGGYT